MLNQLARGALLMVMLGGAGIANGASLLSPTTEEMADAHRWVVAKFQGGIEGEAKPGLTVIANHDPVQKNGRAGKPLRLGEQQYTRGLFCHAFSKLLARLPGPGATFTAIAGVDTNEQTSGGRGSVDFSVQVGGEEKFRSGVMHEGMAAKAVQVALSGATEFVLLVDPTPDGIACDQADWAEAKVTLQNGRELWLADLPMTETDSASRFAVEPPFSFTYAGQPASALLDTWKLTREARTLDAQRVEHTLRWTDPKTGLEVRCAAIEYRDFPAVEWTLYFKNTGQADTPILENIQALNSHFPRGSRAFSLLHYAEGGYNGPNAYQPHEVALDGDNSDQRFTPDGRGSDRFLPYFNLEYDDGGVVLAVGWPGQWSSQFTREGAVVAGQEQTHFVLHPGEEVRSPLIALVFWKVDWLRGQNLWRHWLLAYNLPTHNGQPLPPQLAGCSSSHFGEMIHANEANQILFVDRYVAERLTIDYWWMDAGWYFNNGRWDNTGTWEVDTQRFPHGLRAITDHAHQKGVKSIVWFEPERVTPGTWLWDKHPEWLLGHDANNRLLNLGNPQARQWLTDHVDHLLTEQGIDLYRQDFNINPLGIWRDGEAPDRQGITEIHYIEGYLSYWDELRRRHPGMLIDSCSSGGRRNDLETMRRSVPLLRSDDIGRPENEQGHTYGFALWMPYQGTGSATDAYHFRSSMNWHMTIGPDARRDDVDWAEARRLIGQWRQVAPYYVSDYYPLTPYTLSENAWIAWQFNRPKQGDGMAQVFRRAQCNEDTLRLRLRGLQPNAHYRFTDLDTNVHREMTGKELMDIGAPVTLPNKPQSAIIQYQQVR